MVFLMQFRDSLELYIHPQRENIIALNKPHLMKQMFFQIPKSFE